MLFSLNECVPTYAVLSLFFFREPLGASSDPAGSESLPALLQHCITKAKGGAANNNNNTTSVRGTGLCHSGDLTEIVWPVCYFVSSRLSPVGACPSQTQQQSQTPPEGEDLSLHRKRKRQKKKNPYLYLTSLLHRRQSEEDQTGILASADSEGPNYGTLRWPRARQAIGLDSTKEPTSLPPTKKRPTSASAAPRRPSPPHPCGGGAGRGSQNDLRSETEPADKNNGFSKLLVSEETWLENVLQIYNVHT